MTTLISFLGKAHAGGQYQTTTYRFSEDCAYKEQFFGLGLVKFIRPERLILVGTSGSMWDVFFGHLEIKEGELLALMESAEGSGVTEEQLAGHAQWLTEHLGLPVECLLIPYARDEVEQANILVELSARVAPGEQVVLDVTHGFRHLPMLMLVAARYLSHVHKVSIKNIYYGAFEMKSSDTEEAPVLDLGHMLRMLDWTEALAVYGKSGDYGVFSPLLQADGMAPADAAQLAKGAFAERSNNPVRAKAALSGALRAVDSHDGLLGRLFRDALAENISWVRRGNRADWELALADRYLEREDYLRAVTFLYEGLVSRAVYVKKGDWSDFKQRADAFEELYGHNPEARLLEWLRNAMVHGVRARQTGRQRDAGEITSLLNDGEKLREKLYKIRRTLFQER